MRDVQPGCPNFLDKKDSRFKKLHGALDSHFHRLHSNGVGRDVKHARVLTEEDENKLWTSGVFETTSPIGLQNAVFYTVGKIFSLRGGIEMREFSLSQLKRLKRLKRLNGPDRYVYTENVQTAAHSNVLASKTKLLSPYMLVQTLNSDVLFTHTRVLTDDIFYVRRLDMVPSDPSKPWYSTTAVGKNQLEKKLAKICKRAGISGNITNHSLRATSATQLYRSGGLRR